jgi:hypothetical protein
MLVLNTEARAVGQDTGEIKAFAFVPENLDISFLRAFDRDYGRCREENQGYVVYTFKFEGKKKPRSWQKILSFLPGNWEK